MSTRTTVAMIVFITLIVVVALSMAVSFIAPLSAMTMRAR